MKKYIFILLIIGFWGNSCTKNSSDLAKQNLELLNELGFNTKNVIFENSNSHSATAPISFDSKEEAKLYFKTINDHKGVFQGNKKLQWKLKNNFDPIVYIKEKIKETKEIKDHNTSSSQNCLYPWMENCQLEEVEGDDPPGIASCNQWIAWTGYNVNFSYSYQGGSYVVSNPNSGLIGFHLGVSWDQGATNFVNYPNSSLIYFNVIGYQHYNIIVEGLGTVFTQTVTITGTYNTNTGTYTMSSTP